MNELIYNPKDYHANDGQHDYHVWTYVDYHYDPEMDFHHTKHMETVAFRDEYSGWNDE